MAYVALITGASWRGRFGDAGWAKVERHMRLDFEAPARLTEALHRGRRLHHRHQRPG